MEGVCLYPAASTVIIFFFFFWNLKKPKRKHSNSRHLYDRKGGEKYGVMWQFAINVGFVYFISSICEKYVKGFQLFTIQIFLNPREAEIFFFLVHNWWSDSKEFNTKTVFKVSWVPYVWLYRKIQHVAGLDFVLGSIKVKVNFQESCWVLDFHRTSKPN